MRKAVFFDRDGVINSDEGHYYIFKPEDFKLNPDIIDSMVLLHQAGFLLFVISNQAGIAKGLYKKTDSDNLHTILQNNLQKHNVSIAEIYYCPHHPEYGKCICRKPNSLMLEKAIARFEIDVNQSFLIGDSDRDIEAACKVGIRGIKVEKNYSVKELCKSIAEK